jgi:hypothetical protein
MKKILKCKSTKAIIAEANDIYYYRNQMFPEICLADSQISSDEEKIRHSFYDDIAMKYNLPRNRVGNYLQHYTTEILRSLFIFGDHEYIIDNFRIRYEGSF